jgi:DNA adenine methylase
MFEPAVKWSGSKRKQAEEIINRMPREIGTYYEPFCGGCSVLRRLLSSGVKVGRYVCSDANPDLISLWNAIKTDPKFLIGRYTKMWFELNADQDLERKKKYFKIVRDRFNAIRQPEDFLFIMRTTTNGMPRYNDKGEFNNSFHITRNGILPSNLEWVIEDWSCILNRKKVEFICQDYREVKPEKGDFLYLDPPYAGTKGMYHGGIDLDSFWEYLRGLKCGYALSFDGKIAGGEDFTHPVPEDLYTKHEYLDNGNSSFRRIIGNNTHADILESIYIKEASDGKD